MPHPQRRPEWKQPTPEMQLTAIRGSLEGWVSNYEDGITTRMVFIDQMYSHLKQISDLQAFFEKATWE